MARLRSDFWVSAYLRRCNMEGATAVLRRRGSAEAGAIFIKVDRLDGSADLYGPVPQAGFDDSLDDDRQFSAILSQVETFAVEDRMKREIRFDSDLWLVEIETRGGEHFLSIANDE